MTLPSGFVDLHAHVLPGIDDGPPDLATSVALLRAAADGGTAAIVATTHSAEVLQMGFDAAAMEARMAEVQAAAQEAGVAIEVAYGAEIFVESDSVQRLTEGRLFPLHHTRYVLIEPPFGALPLYLNQALFELQTNGYIPILAHPERNSEVQEQPRRLEEWAARGAFIQMSAASLLGGFGRAAQRTAKLAIGRRLCHVIASDAHDPVRRPPMLRPAYDAVAREFGAATAQALFVTHPAAVYAGQMLHPPEPLPLEPATTSGLFRRLLGRS